MKVSHQDDHTIPLFCQYESFRRTYPLVVWAAERTGDVLFETQWKLLIMGSGLCLDSKGEGDPPLTDWSVVKSEKKNLPLHESFARIAKLSIMGSFLCVDSYGGRTCYQITGSLFKGQLVSLIPSRSKREESSSFTCSGSSTVWIKVNKWDEEQDLLAL